MCFVAFCFSVILAVSCSSSNKKKTKKNIVALTQYSRARIFPHTLFDFKKLQVSRQDLYFSPYKKLSLSFSACWRFAPSLPFITRSVVPAAAKKSLCLSVSSIPTGQQSKHTAGIEGKEDGSIYSKIPSGHPLSHGGGHRSSQVGTHVRRCPRLRLLRIQ